MAKKPKAGKSGTTGAGGGTSNLKAPDKLADAKFHKNEFKDFRDNGLEVKILGIEKPDKDAKDLKENKEFKEHKDDKDFKDGKEFKEHKDNKDHKDKENKVEKPELQNETATPFTQLQQKFAKEIEKIQQKEIEKTNVKSEHEKFQQKEIEKIKAEHEKQLGKEKDGKELAEGPADPAASQRFEGPGDGDAAHFINPADRPDLSGGALSGEADKPKPRRKR